ncbi:cct motif family protein, partial [Trifolium pratense]
MWDGYGCDVNGNTWKVPDGVGASNNNMKVKEEMGWKLGQREASLLRYKEKRQSRLFAKRIRYEVRKLNAEKRPRMKEGRWEVVVLEGTICEEGMKKCRAQWTVVYDVYNVGGTGVRTRTIPPTSTHWETHV